MGRPTRSHLNYTEPQIDSRYVRQQQFLRELCEKNGWVYFRPNYHAQDTDCNTVMIYRREDEEYNKALEARGFGEFYIAGQRTNSFRDPFFTFANTDVNGRGDLNFANFGTIDLRWTNWQTRLEGAVKLGLAKRIQNNYIALCGGILSIREADDTYNDFNRSIIEAYRMKNGGKAYIGRVNGEKDEPILTEYVGQMVYNFGCDFVIPTEDVELVALIKKKNEDGASMETLRAIQRRIDSLKGEHFHWV